MLSVKYRRLVNWYRVLVTRGLQCTICARLHGAVGSASERRSRGRKFKSALDHTTFVETDHEIIPSVILPLPLIQERQVSGTGERLHIITGFKPSQEKYE